MQLNYKWGNIKRSSLLLRNNWNSFHCIGLMFLLSDFKWIAIYGFVFGRGESKNNVIIKFNQIGIIIRHHSQESGKLKTIRVIWMLLAFAFFSLLPSLAALFMVMGVIYCYTSGIININWTLLLSGAFFENYLSAYLIVLSRSGNLFFDCEDKIFSNLIIKFLIKFC